MPFLADGNVTFLFTDIEGSTNLWEKHPDAMRVALARHDALLRQAIESNSGVVFKTLGDAFCAVFATASNSVSAALALQLLLHGEIWEQTGPLRVRVALHTGPVQERDNDYFGPTLNRVARLQSIGYGQQTLLSQATYNAVHDTLPPAVTIQEMGTHQLKDLQTPETVFQMLHPDLPASFPPLRSLNNPELLNNLPHQVTSFIGRETEITAVKSLLGRTRLLTLTGSGGCGKTRLGLQVAAEALESYPDGAWFVELAPLADPMLVPQTLAQALRLAEEPGKPVTQTLAETLKAKRLLIVLDNCEHVLDACARLVNTLLHICPHVQVLASSRAALGITGETVYRLPSLSLPDRTRTPTPGSLNRCESVRLFVERATAAQSTFALTETNAPAMAQVCHRLDGIPLALELAAARVRSLSVEEINHRLDNRFRLLTGGSRTALPRQQTLRALIDWSYDLLTNQEKTLLNRLAVFADGWTLEAAEYVGADADSFGGDGEERTGSLEEWEVLDVLTSLVDKSLVVAHTEGSHTRYRLLETVRQYARDRLTESGAGLAVRARHSNYFLTLAEECRIKFSGPEQARRLGMLEEEHDNMRQALTLYVEDRSLDTLSGVKGLRLAAALQEFWRIRGYLTEGREWLSAILSHPGGQEYTIARADALNGAAVLARMQGDYEALHTLNEASLKVFRKLGNKKGIAATLNISGYMAFEQGDYARTRVLLEESLAIFREIGEKSNVAALVSNLGNLACEQGDYDRAQALYQESLGAAREMGDERHAAEFLANLSAVAQQQGDYDKARSLQQESLTAFQKLGEKRMITNSLEAFASLAAQEACPERSARLWGAAAVLREELGTPLAAAERKKQERLAADAQDALGEAAFAAAWAKGRAMTLEQAVAYALEEKS